MTAARAIVNIETTLPDPPFPFTVSLPAGVLFETTIDNTTYTFQTRETIEARSDGSGIYRFGSLTDGSRDISIFEGRRRVRSFIADDISQSPVYVIPDRNLDIETCRVRVYESANTGRFSTYTNIKDATIINDSTALFVLKEAPNGFYELSFGTNSTFGIVPLPGYRIEVEYLSVSGRAANEASVFTASPVSIAGQNDVELRVRTITSSVGGDDKEDIDSIRQNAPFQYATQNRMVTADDYSSLVLRNFRTLIKDIKSYGGEDALEPEYGTVFMSIVFKDDVPLETQEATKLSIQSLVDQLSVATFNLRFIDPVTTFVETNTFFQFNPRLTTQSVNRIQDSVSNVILDYFRTNVGRFDQSFRRSNLLTLIDAVSPAVLSSRIDVKMQQRIVPRLNADSNHNIRFPTLLAIPDDRNHIITSSTFRIGDQAALIRNRLNSNVLEVVTIDGLATLVDNVGNYEPEAGRLNIVGLNINSIVSLTNYIKIAAVPANQSAINPVREDIIVFDPAQSFTSPIQVDAT